MSPIASSDAVTFMHSYTYEATDALVTPTAAHAIGYYGCVPGSPRSDQPRFAPSEVTVKGLADYCTDLI